MSRRHAGSPSKVCWTGRQFVLALLEPVVPCGRSGDTKAALTCRSQILHLGR